MIEGGFVLFLIIISVKHKGSSAAVGPDLGAEAGCLRVEDLEAGGRCEDDGSRVDLVLLRCESVSGSSSFLEHLYFLAASLHDSFDAIALKDSSNVAYSDVFSSFSLSLVASKVSGCSAVRSSGVVGALSDRR